MGNLANTYDALGRHQDSLELKEKTLEFKRRVLPANHPEIAMTCFCLSGSLARAGNFRRAILYAREALHVYQATLPPSHPHVESALGRVSQIERDIALRA